MTEELNFPVVVFLSLAAFFIAALVGLLVFFTNRTTVVKDDNQ